MNSVTADEMNAVLLQMEWEYCYCRCTRRVRKVKIHHM